MNEALYTNANGLRLIQEYEGAPRLKARLCEGNSFELSYGVTFDLNGNPFNADSTCTPEESDTLFRNALQIFERGVRDLVTVPLNSNQFSGLTAFAWNIGLTNFAGSSVLRRVNENRMDDAAACFGMWIFATNGAGHKQALRGLLRRRYSESALFMGYSWTQACDDDAIALQREIPETLPGTDRVIYRTPFKDVLMVAQRFPLAPADELVLTQPAPPLATSGSKVVVGSVPVVPPVQTGTSSNQVSPAPTDRVVPPVVVAKKPEPVPASPAPPARAPVPAPLPTQVGTKPPSVNTKMPEHVPYRVDEKAGLKPMEETERFVGAALMLFGTFARVIMANTTAVTGVGGVLVVGVLDMMKSPTNLAILITVITMGVTAVLWVLAFIIDKLGLKIKKRGEKSATQAMY